MSLIVAGLSVLIGLIVLCAAPPRDAARILPWLPCWIAFALGCGVLCGLGAVPLYALQAFAGERRERTGEQLLLTALHPGDIVLGKLKGLLGGGGPLALAGALLAAAGGLPLAINEYAGSSWARVAEDILGPTVLTVTIGCSLLIFLTLAALLVSLSVPNAGLGLLALALIGGLGQLFIGGITSLAQETAGWALALPVYLGGNALGCAALYFIAVGRVRAGLTAR